MDYSGDTNTLTVIINEKEVEKPVSDTTSFVYTGNDQIYTIAANDLYTVSGTNKKAHRTHFLNFVRFFGTLNRLFS